MTEVMNEWLSPENTASPGSSNWVEVVAGGRPLISGSAGWDLRLHMTLTQSSRTCVFGRMTCSAGWTARNPFQSDDTKVEDHAAI